MPSHESEEFHWFSLHLRPHEALLRAWLRSQFGASLDVDDIVQEAYTRVLQARTAAAIASPKAFLFTTARNVALMQLRHRRVERSEPLAEIDGESILDESSDVAADITRAEELELLTQAIQSLPARCRQILTLRKIYGLSQREVAAELGISVHTVEAQGTIALTKLAAFFAQREGSGRRATPSSERD